MFKRLRNFPRKAQSNGNSFNLVKMLLLSITVLTTSSSYADIDEFLRKNLNSLSQNNSGGAYQALDRGVYYGGSYNLRNQILMLQLLSFDAPYINAGCGGIDLYAGSFSFINKEQFKQLMKAVAANAAGYSFNLALNHMCPTCAQTVDSLQKKIQQINQHLGNSCTLAQGLVNDTLAAFGKSTNNKISLMAHLKGLGDTFSTFSAESSQHKQELLKDPKIKQTLYGNLVYKALVDSYDTKFSKAYYEQIMSITGTLITLPGKDKNLDKTKKYSGELLSVQQMLKGGEYTKYACKDKDCHKLDLVTSNYEKASNRIRRLYLGDATSPGVISQYANNSNSLTPTQKQELSLVGMGINSMVRRLARLNEQAARDFVVHALDVISIKFIHHEIEYAFKLVSNALAQIEDNVYLTALTQQLQNSHSNYLNNLAIENNKHNQLTVISYYNQLINAFDVSKGGIKAK